MKSERSWITRFALDTFEQPFIVRAIAQDVPPYFAEYPLDYSGSSRSRNERRQRDPLYGGELWTSTLPDGVTLGRDRDGIRLLRNIGQTPDGTNVTVLRRVLLSPTQLDVMAVKAGNIHVGIGESGRFSGYRYRDGLTRNNAWLNAEHRWSGLTINERKTLRRALKVVHANRPRR
ncbi:MAG TPA: hypothetical protein VLF20_04595 [Patescibacteria group bacterium]|nr:hypothetical protein [Patescibacteria group bacterium]